MKKNYYYQLGF